MACCWFSPCTRFSMRVHTAGAGCCGVCSSFMLATRLCHTRAAARTGACSRAMASKRRRAPPRSVPSAWAAASRSSSSGCWLMFMAVQSGKAGHAGAQLVQPAADPRLDGAQRQLQLLRQLACALEVAAARGAGLPILEVSAGATPPASRECHAANSEVPPSEAARSNDCACGTLAAGGFSSITCSPERIASAATAARTCGGVHTASAAICGMAARIAARTTS